MVNRSKKVRQVLKFKIQGSIRTAGVLAATTQAPADHNDQNHEGKTSYGNTNNGACAEGLLIVRMKRIRRCAPKIGVAVSGGVVVEVRSERTRGNRDNQLFRQLVYTVNRDRGDRVTGNNGGGGAGQKQARGLGCRLDPESAADIIIIIVVNNTAIIIRDHQVEDVCKCHARHGTGDSQREHLCVSGVGIERSGINSTNCL